MNQIENMELLKSFVLKVELFAGTDVQDVAREMCILAGRVGVMIEADFNSVKLWARPGDDYFKLVESFHRELQSGKTHKIARA